VLPRRVGYLYCGHRRDASGSAESRADPKESPLSADLLDAVCIGNAIVDVISAAEPEFLSRHELVPGSMNLIDETQAETLYGQMGPGREISGGSAGNTAAGIASLGGACGFIGKVHNDELGNVYTHDMRAARVEFTTAHLVAGPATARSLILVTPDAERTMNTFLGACVELGPDDIDEDQIARAQVTYMEGYLWDPPLAKDAFRRAIQIAHGAGRKTALTLSDSFCVDRYRQEFLQLLEGDIDILFANEDELKSLYQVEDFDDALQRVQGHCEIAALTRSEKGSVVVRGNEVHIIDAAPVDRVVDTTGAGDLYASGFLYGLARDYDLKTCGTIAGLAAAEIISHYGARPETQLKKLVDERITI
jgi:sugar/nucleoside kinase (ribokinase family)